MKRSTTLNMNRNIRRRNTYQYTTRIISRLDLNDGCVRGCLLGGQNRLCRSRISAM